MSRCWGSARRTAQEGQRAEGSLGREVGAGLPAVAEATHGSSAAIAAAGGRNQPGLGGGDEATHRDAASVEQEAKGNRYLRRLLCQIAWGAIHTKDTFFAGLFARLKPRIECKGAAWAVAHRIGKVIWLVLHQQVEYREMGSAPPNERTLMRKFRRLLKDFGKLGVDVRAVLNQQLTITA